MTNPTKPPSLKPLPTYREIVAAYGKTVKRYATEQIIDEYAAPAYAEVERLKGELDRFANDIKNMHTYAKELQRHNEAMKVVVDAAIKFSSTHRLIADESPLLKAVTNYQNNQKKEG